jgi:single-stranded-DNA-specific exonuclease
LPRLAARLLSNRGIVAANEVMEFLAPDYRAHLHDPLLFRDMERVVARFSRAIAERQAIVVYGDYDADGVCSAAVLTTTLQLLGANVVEVYLPHREREGYGLNRQAVERFITRGVSLIVTLDCGTTNVEEILLARQGGIDVVVIDHHHVPDGRLGAFAILNPKTPGERYPFKHLASVGVAFKTAQALLRRRAADNPAEASRCLSFEKWLLDLVAIATVTDLVPLVGENRTLLKYGLLVLNRTARPGLRALVTAMGAAFGSLDASSIGFQIGPRLNAAGRMDHARAAYELLVCEDEARATVLAAALEASNRERQQATERITAEARAALAEQRDDRVLVAVGEGWPVGLVGLVASRLLDEYRRPVLVVGRSERGLIGSGRSPSAFNIIEALHQLPGLFTKFGGHAQACGFTLKGEAELTALRRHLNALATERLSDDDLAPVIAADATLLLADVGEELHELLKLFEPYGMGNPKPRFWFTTLRVVGRSNVGAAGQHLKLTLSDERGTVRQAIGFNLAAALPAFKLGDAVDLVAEVVMSQWHGRRELQIKVLDVKPSLRS